MALIESPDSSQIVLAVDPTYQALRASLYPREFNHTPAGPPLGGHYRLATFTGLTTIIASGGAIFSMRWTDSALRFILQRLQMYCVINTAFTTAQEQSVDLVKIVNFSAADTGGTALIPINDSYKKKLSMGNSIINDLRVATTAALTPGTGTIQPSHSSVVFPLSLNSVGSSSFAQLYDMRPGEEAPLEIGPNSGFKIRILQTQGVVGVVRFHVIMDWAEVPNIQA